MSSALITEAAPGPLSNDLVSSFSLARNEDNVMRGQKQMYSCPHHHQCKSVRHLLSWLHLCYLTGLTKTLLQPLSLGFCLPLQAPGFQIPNGPAQWAHKSQQTVWGAAPPCSEVVHRDKSQSEWKNSHNKPSQKLLMFITEAAVPSHLHFSLS